MRNFIVCVVAVFLGCSHEQRPVVTPAAIASLPAMPVVPSSPRTTFYLDFTTPKGWSARFNAKEDATEVHSTVLDAVISLRMEEFVDQVDVDAVSKNVEREMQEEIASRGDASPLQRWDAFSRRQMARWYCIGNQCERERQVFVFFPRAHPQIVVTLRGEWPGEVFVVRNDCNRIMSEFASSVRVMMIETPR